MKSNHMEVNEFINEALFCIRERKSSRTESLLKLTYSDHDDIFFTNKMKIEKKDFFKLYENAFEIAFYDHKVLNKKRKSKIEKLEQRRMLVEAKNMAERSKEVLKAIYTAMKMNGIKVPKDLVHSN